MMVAVGSTSGWVWRRRLRRRVGIPWAAAAPAGCSCRVRSGRRRNPEWPACS